MASQGSSKDGDEPKVIDKLKRDPRELQQEAHAKEEVLKVEDEQTQLRLMTLISEQLHRPASISSIEVHGAKNTRRSFLDPLFRPLVESSRNVGTTLGDVLEGLQTATSKLNRFDIFKSEPTIYLADARSSDPQAAGTDLDVSIRVAEKSRFIFKAGTDVGNTEGSAYTNAVWRNMFGGAETLSVNASAGTRTRSAYTATFSSPIASNPDFRVAVEGFASSSQKPWASHEEVLRGGTLRLAWLSSAGNTHALAYSAAWRQLTGLAPGASPTVRGDAGDSVKSSITHTFSRDRRDNPLLPQSGYLVRTSSELAGWGPLQGDVSFSKSELELSGAVPVPFPGEKGYNRKRITLGGSFRFGMLYPLPFGYSFGGRARPSRVNDRFQLGGPTDVRGFKIGGIGPHDGADSVGGDVYAAGSLNLLLPLPRTGPESPLRLQLFANGGRLTALSNKGKGKVGKEGAGLDSKTVWNGMVSALGELVNGLPSTSAGVGLVYAHSVARFELNFSLPLVLRRGEEGRKGLQVGVGINFL
ncbi:hypothetical protein VTK73DRAFT_3536 [Phialemonium thermophilum]|uniref:Bacterial surface antigen (D15) domain-containing protein n=1 Tax=Phialemonium thermophilum TaxID=223376 RepID=A0ABR3Y0E7_9PEZI